jgi:hypothetical protein
MHYPSVLAGLVASRGLPPEPVASRKLVSQLSVVGVAYATWSSFPVVVGSVVSSAIGRPVASHRVV